MQERRHTATGVERKTFALIARRALEKHVPEARTGAASWGSKANLGWVRFPREDGRLLYLALRRHLNWVTGEIGLSPDPRDLEALALSAVPDDKAGAAFRVRLGHLLHDEDKWWPAGDTERALNERLEWLALQMRVKVDAFLRERR